ncbi:hypothetical protein H2200_011673 [Cladophialophora chaetospira]|uniref:Uncharacterized protein n=1 Tax=Cladophialophora chaetospira TaxID=386627 RepID=A0AA38WZS6_9EURO|nr:hypothetical protein H2200_011673 [Cladophialophora chaetospira]
MATHSVESAPRTPAINLDISNKKSGFFVVATADGSQEGIGGVLKKKVKRRVKTGAYTYEYADERESGRFLEREQTGAVRSWCGWCARIVPSVKDRDEPGLDLVTI